MQIDGQLIAYLEDLSCLVLSQDEKAGLTADLEKILSSLERLGALDTEGVPERSHPFDAVNAFREDEACASFPPELILQNAPASNDEMFIAPRTVE